MTNPVGCASFKNKPIDNPSLLKEGNPIIK